MKIGIINREFTEEEKIYIDIEDFTIGTKVYPFFGTTYGCIGSGTAITLNSDNSNPFQEIPEDAITWSNT